MIAFFISEKVNMLICKTNLMFWGLVDSLSLKIGGMSEGLWEEQSYFPFIPVHDSLIPSWWLCSSLLCICKCLLCSLGNVAGGVESEADVFSDLSLCTFSSFWYLGLIKADRMTINEIVKKRSLSMCVYKVSNFPLCL